MDYIILLILFFTSEARGKTKKKKLLASAVSDSTNVRNTHIKLHSSQKLMREPHMKNAERFFRP